MTTLKGLRYHRITNDLSQAAVASLLGITTSHYSKLERGKVQIKLRHLIKLAELFKVPIENLV